MAKNKLYLSICGFSFRIQFKYPFKKKEKTCTCLPCEIYSKYKNFLVSKKPRKIDYSIIVYKPHFHEAFKIFYRDAKGFRRNYLFLFDEEKNKIHTYAQIGIHQFDFLMTRLLQKLLAREGGFILHGSSVIINNKCIVFLGKSGAGKSTIVKLLSQYFKPFTDDNVVVRKMRGGFFCYQSPIVEKENWIRKNKKGYIMSRFFFLKKSKKCKARRIEASPKLVKRFLQHLWSDPESFTKQKDGVMFLFQRVDIFYNLYFSKIANDIFGILK